MKSNELKFLASLAKKRLTSKNYEEVSVQSKSKASNYFIQNALALRKVKFETNYVTISTAEDDEFVSKVKTILSEDCYNPLGRLCDKSYFDTLDKFQKEFYILSLSEKYNKVKNDLKLRIS